MIPPDPPGAAIPLEPDDYAWALERVTQLCANALADAQVYGQKLLKGFGYPNETFRAAQDYRALNIVLAALAESQQRAEAAEQKLARNDRLCDKALMRLEADR